MIRIGLQGILTYKRSMSELSLQEAYVLDPIKICVLYTHCVCVGGPFLTFSIKTLGFRWFSSVFDHFVYNPSQIIISKDFYQTHVICYPFVNFFKQNNDCLHENVGGISFTIYSGKSLTLTSYVCSM